MCQQVVVPSKLEEHIPPPSHYTNTTLLYLFVGCMQIVWRGARKEHCSIGCNPMFENKHLTFSLFIRQHTQNVRINISGLAYGSTRRTQATYMHSSFVQDVIISVYHMDED
jgi:hypothetical protein